MDRLLPPILLASACSSPPSQDAVQAVDSGSTALADTAAPRNDSGTTDPPVESTCPAPSLELVREWGEAELIDPSELTPGILTGGPGVALGDLDGDGWLDAVMAIPLAPSLAFRNDGTGQLESAAKLPAANSVSLGDVDGDGRPEVFLSTANGTPDLLMHAGASPFASDSWTAQPLGGPDGESSTASFADLDGDGDLDLAVARWVSHFDLSDWSSPVFELEPSVVFLNDSGTLVPHPAALPDDGYLGSPFMLQPYDADHDGDLDLYVSNDFGMMLTPNRLLLNDGTGTFTRAEDCSCEVAGFTMGASVGDTDQDGDEELFITDLGQTHLLASEGDGRYYDAARATGAYLAPTEDSFASWGSAIVDLDLDGWPEVVSVFGKLLLDGSSLDSYGAEAVEDGWVDSDAQRDRLLWNTGDGHFTDISATAGFEHTGVGRAVAVGDLDRDGIPDLVTAGIPFLRVWRTSGGCGTSITVQDAPPGARVEYTVAGETHWSTVHPATTFSASAHEAVLGLAGQSRADTVRVWWGSALLLDATDVSAGSTLEVPPP